MNTINFDVEQITTIDYFGRTVFRLDTKGGYQLPFDIEPTIGNHNYKKCKKCQKNLAVLTNVLTTKFNGTTEIKGFPFCCLPHSNLIKLEDFSKELFTNVPTMVANKIIYTTQHIKNNYKQDNWFRIITHYIDWAIDSFGHIPVDCGERLFLTDYYESILTFINDSNELPIDKKVILLDFVSSYRQPATDSKFDLFSLVKTYQTWLKEFPFELSSYFGGLKQHFIDSLPVLNGGLERNIYSGRNKAKMHTQGSLIVVLLNLTKELLGTIVAKDLVEKKLITDYNQHEFELVSKSLQTATSILTNDFSLGELKYVETINKWLELHKAYFKEITPLLHIVKDKTITQNIPLSEQFIKYDLIPRLNALEVTIKPIKDKFKESKIKCAAWVELLMEKHFFLVEHTSTRPKSCTDFAKARYGVDIFIQTQTAQNAARNTNKKMLEKYFKIPNSSY